MQWCILYVFTTAVETLFIWRLCKLINSFADLNFTFLIKQCQFSSQTHLLIALIIWYIQYCNTSLTTLRPQYKCVRYVGLAFYKLFNILSFNFSTTFIWNHLVLKIGGFASTTMDFEIIYKCHHNTLNISLSYRT